MFRHVDAMSTDHFCSICENPLGGCCLQALGSVSPQDSLKNSANWSSTIFVACTAPDRKALPASPLPVAT